VSRAPHSAATVDFPPIPAEGLAAAREAAVSARDSSISISVETFAQLLQESGLLTTSEMAEVRLALPQHSTTESLAESLYRQGKLTKYQLTRVIQGKARSLFLGNYIVQDKIGQGGMGLVVKARHRVMQRIVAIKLLSTTTMKSTDAVRRFHREVEAAAQLNHPNIVAAFDADQANGTHFLVMEYVDGCNLAHLVRNQGPLSIKRSIEFLLQAGRGLEYAHAHGIVHRDIKPGNLLIDRSGVVKILDLGLARQQNDDQASDLTGSGQIMGTIDYMAPEQAVNTRSADHRSDIYSFGCTLWYLLTGHSVYDGDTALAKLLAHRDNPIPPLLGTSVELSYTQPRAVAIDRVIRKMLAKNPDQRYQSMAEVLIALEGCLTGKVLEDTPAQPQEPLAAFLTYLAAGEDAASAVDATEKTVVRPEFDLSQLHDSSDGFTLSSRVALRTIASPREQKRSPRSIWFYVGLAVVGLGLALAALSSGSSREQKSSVVVPPADRANATPAAPQPESNSEPLDALEEAWSWKTPDTLPTSGSKPGSTPDRSYQLAFDGASSYAVVPSLKYDPNQEYTIEGWFTLLGERQSTTDPVIWTGPRWIAIWEQYQRFGLGTTGTGPTEIISSHFPAPPMVPVHVAGIWNKSGQTLYVGGRMVMTSDTGSAPYPATSGGFFLGGAPEEFLHHDRWYRGGIDEVRISRGTRYRMKNIVPLRRFPDRDSDTLALYHMDEGYSEKLTDSSGNGHHGQIVGAHWIPELRDKLPPFRKLKP
jgi:serine/threonine protein kinase